MYYSVTFTNSSDEKRNTWEDWRLIPTAPPMIEPPEVYTNYVDIPGRKTGPVDLSEALTNGPAYKSSEGSWEFVSGIENDNRPETYSQLKAFLHGKTMKIVLEEDPYHYYNGRFYVEAPRTGKGRNMYGIKYQIMPVRYNLDGTQDGI